jgi:Cu+-exporting ATPase
MSDSSPSNKQEPCFHCGDPCLEIVNFDDKLFCCNGCKTVYQVLTEQNLDDFYSIEQSPGVKPKSSVSDSSYKFLEVESIAKEFIDFQEGEIAKTTLSLPQIHCASCVWLLENLHKLNEGVISAEVNFISRKASIVFNTEKLTLRDLALVLDRVGYSPVFDKNKSNKRVTSNFILKLATAGFCFGNIMLFSFPEYLVDDPAELEGFRSFFSWLILALSIPVFLYSAGDYMISAFKAVRTKTLNLDVPIALGIIVLYVKSVSDILMQEGPGYMDSFAGFVFLLLVGRWFQNKTYDALSFERDYKSYFPMAVSRLTGEKEEVVPVQDLNIDELIITRNQEIVPADSVLMSASASIDYSFVTGESRIVEKHSGDIIYAGGKQVGSSIELRTIKGADDSYLASLWNQKAFGQTDEGFYTKLTDKLSRYFLLGVLIVASMTAGAWSVIDAGEIVNVVTAVLIVACPCALALAVPFTYGNTQRFMGRAGLYLRNSVAIEQMSGITDIIFDKTGTLTRVESSGLTFSNDKLDEHKKTVIKSLVSHSMHPLSQAISDLLVASNKKEVTQFGEESGKGISGKVGNDLVMIGSASFTSNDPSDETRVYVNINDEQLGFFRFGNEYRTGVGHTLQALSDFDLHLLSGDSDAEKPRLEKFFGAGSMLFNQEPQDKLEYVQNLQSEGRKVMMVGDGLNDAGALAQSDVGIALAENIHDFSPASDAILDSRRLEKLPDFILLSKKSRQVLKVCFAFSILYNTVGLGFAITGSLTPLVAAILMPLSSISVILLSTFLTYTVSRKVFS